MSYQQHLAFEPTIHNMTLQQLLALPIRGLSLLQPWATLAALSLKKLETRSWYTPYRGGLAIHASMGKPRAVRELCTTDPFIRAALDAAGLTYNTLPRGGIIGYAQLVDVRQIQNSPLATSAPVVRPGELTPHERAFGDYQDGRYAWLLTDTVALETMIPVTGKLQLWNMTSAVQEQVMQQVYQLLQNQR